MYLKKVCFLALSCLLLNVGFSQVYTYKNIEINFKGLRTDSIKNWYDMIFDIEVKAKDKGSCFYSDLEFGPDNVYGNFYFEILQYDKVQSKWINITDSIRGSGPHYFGLNGEYDFQFDREKTKFSVVGEVRKFQIAFHKYATDLMPGMYLVNVYLRVDTILGRDLSGKIIKSNIVYLESKENIFYRVDDANTLNILSK